MNRYVASGMIACLTLTTLTACRNRPGNGNDELPADVQKAVDEVVAQLESTSQAVGGAVEALTNVDSTQDNFGDCPEVIFVRQDNVTTIGVTFEAGCSSEYYDDAVSGTISAVFDRTQNAFTASFDAFTVDGQTTNGDLNVSRTSTTDVRNWSGSIDITTSGVGSVSGDLAFEINLLTDTLTISSALLDLTHVEGDSFTVEVDGIVIRPVANQSFIPEAGTVTFEVPNADPEGPETLTIVVEFDQNSPDDGTVTVTYDEGTVENYPLTGF